MEPKDPNKKIEDILKNWNFSFTVPIHTFKFPVHKQETVDEVIMRLDEVDETIDAMTEYPQAKRMLDNLYGKQ